MVRLGQVVFAPEGPESTLREKQLFNRIGSLMRGFGVPPGVPFLVDPNNLPRVPPQGLAPVPGKMLPPGFFGQPSQGKPIRPKSGFELPQPPEMAPLGPAFQFLRQLIPGQFLFGGPPTPPSQSLRELLAGGQWSL